MTKTVTIGQVRRTSLNNLSQRLKQPHFSKLLTSYMNSYLGHPLPASWSKNLEFSTHPSVLAVFHSPSDSPGLWGISRERIRAISSWRRGPGRYDTVFTKDTPDAQSVGSGLATARVQLFFSFYFQNRKHDCALITYFRLQGTSPDANTGLWVVRPCYPPKTCIIPLDHILRAVHLIPVYGKTKVPKEHSPSQTLDKYKKFYINKYADYHSFKTAGSTSNREQ